MTIFIGKRSFDLARYKQHVWIACPNTTIGSLTIYKRLCGLDGARAMDYQINKTSNDICKNCLREAKKLGLITKVTKLQLTQ